MDNKVAATGRRGTVEWAIDRGGRHPAREFFLALPTSDRAKITALCQRLADNWRIESREHFKNLGGDLWELKRFQLRLLGAFRPGHRFLIAHALRKKKDKHNRGDIKIALRVLRENDEAEEGR